MIQKSNEGVTYFNPESADEVTEAQRTQHSPEFRIDYEAKYPSGKAVCRKGHLKLFDIDGCGIQPALITGDKVYLLDPRAVITAVKRGVVVYNPRQMFCSLAPAFQLWLLENPKWGAT